MVKDSFAWSLDLGLGANILESGILLAYPCGRIVESAINIHVLSAYSGNAGVAYKKV